MLRELIQGAIPAVTAAFWVLAIVFAFYLFIKRFLYVCAPNEILIFSGRSQRRPDGSAVGYRVLTGGRSVRWPILESVDQMDVRLISVPMTMAGAYSEGGIPLAVHAIANVKISSNPGVMGNAIERFLGRSTQEIAQVAKETLEGHLRGVLATMTPEEVNEDRLKFAERLTAEAGPDLNKLGLQLDTLKIQSVTDDREYLDSIGRARIAEIVRTAVVAESDAVRLAEEAEAAAVARGGVAKKQAEAAVQRKTNELRQLQAQLDAKAQSEEERAEQAAAAARAQAEQKLQQVRTEVEKLRLTADVTIPAEVSRQVKEFHAAGEASVIEAKGSAIAQSVEVTKAAWQECGDDAMEMVVMQQLDSIFEQVTAAAARVQPKHVTLVDSGDGSTVKNYIDAYPATVTALLKRVSETFGVDLLAVLSGNGDVSSTPHNGPRGPGSAPRSAPPRNSY